MVRISKTRRRLLFLASLVAIIPAVVWGVTQLIQANNTFAADTDFMLCYDANGGTLAISPGHYEIDANDKSKGYLVIQDPSHPQSVTTGIAPEAPTRPGYTFLGWADSASATTATYSSGSMIEIPASNPVRTIYAVWLSPINIPDANYVVGSKTGLVINTEINATPLSITVDGNSLSSSDYTTNTPSLTEPLVVTILPSYLDTLADGSHVVTITWYSIAAGGIENASANFTVAHSSDPGDDPGGDPGDDPGSDPSADDDETGSTKGGITVPNTGATGHNQSSDAVAVIATGVVAGIALLGGVVIAYRNNKKNHRVVKH